MLPWHAVPTATSSLNRIWFTISARKTQFLLIHGSLKRAIDQTVSTYTKNPRTPCINVAGHGKTYYDCALILLAISKRFVAFISANMCQQWIVAKSNARDVTMCPVFFRSMCRTKCACMAGRDLRYLRVDNFATSRGPTETWRWLTNWYKRKERNCILCSRVLLIRGFCLPSSAIVAIQYRQLRASNSTWHIQWISVNSASAVPNRRKCGENGASLHVLGSLMSIYHFHFSLFLLMSSSPSQKVGLMRTTTNQSTAIMNFQRDRIVSLISPLKKSHGCFIALMLA